MITDIQRVERIVFPGIFIDVLMNGVSDQKGDGFTHSMKLLHATVNECLADLDAKGRAKIIRRCERIHVELLGHFVKEEASALKVGLAAYYALRYVTDCDYLVLPDGCPMSEAMDLVLPAIAPAVEIAKMDKSARKAGRKMLEKLQANGYFVDVPIDAQMNEAA